MTRGTELDLIVWDEVLKEEESTHLFRVMDELRLERKDQAVQTEKECE